jgi:hypothetical protein
MMHTIVVRTHLPPASVDLLELFLLTMASPPCEPTRLIPRHWCQTQHIPLSSEEEKYWAQMNMGDDAVSSSSMPLRSDLPLNKITGTPGKTYFEFVHSLE